MAEQTATRQVKAATTERKPRSLADLVDEQVKAGVLDAEEVNKPVQWRRSAAGGPVGTRYEQQRNQSRQGMDDSSLNWQQKELLGKQAGVGPRHNPRFGFDNDQGTGGFQRKPFENTRGGRNFLKKSPGAGLPEWATDLDTTDTNYSGLNWQQQSLMQRDESDPFNQLVRGENELFRE